jgi:hypothetical protein
MAICHYALVGILNMLIQSIFPLWGWKVGRWRSHNSMRLRGYAGRINIGAQPLSLRLKFGIHFSLRESRLRVVIYCFNLDCLTLLPGVTLAR